METTDDGVCDGPCCYMKSADGGTVEYSEGVISGIHDK